MPYTSHPIFNDPKKDEKLWRYMDLDKFRSLVEKQSLFFCRADKFTDVFEGSITRAEHDYRPLAQRNVMEAVGGNWTQEMIDQNVSALSELQTAMRSRIIISCWHHNDTESDAMWNLYLKDNNGVAIQSTCQRLKESFHRTNHEVNAGMVRYLDYSKDVFYDPKEFDIPGYNFTTPFIHKRSYFAFEREYRAIIQLPDPEDAIPRSEWPNLWEVEEFENGKLIQVDLNKLLERVVFAPGASSNVRNEVESLLESSGLSIPAVESSMNGKPLF